jgi:hypothetical protein
MAIDFRSARIDFDVTAHKIQEETVTVVFGSKVKKAAAVLNGFKVFYDNGDHPTRQHLVDLKKVVKADIIGNSVEVTGYLLLRDNTGEIDDPFGGRIDFTVIADVE